MENFYLPGATTLGIRCEDGIILASEKLLTFGRGIASRSVKKVFKIADHIGIAFAGLVSDFQVLRDTISVYIHLYSLDNKKPISVNAAAKQTSSILYSMRLFPLYTNTIIAGTDKNGPKVFSIDAIGSIIDDDYATIGSGSELAIGVLENDYTQNISVEEGKNLAIRAIRAAAQRDPGSGEAVDVLAIQEAKQEEFSVAIK